MKAEEIYEFLRMNNIIQPLDADKKTRFIDCIDKSIKPVISSDGIPIIASDIAIGQKSFDVVYVDKTYVPYIHDEDEIRQHMFELGATWMRDLLLKK